MPVRARTTTKAPAKRAPSKAAPSPAVDEEEPVVIEGDVVEASDDGPNVEADPDQDPELVGAIVPFHGRQIAVRLPSLEQLVVMRRLAEQYRGYGDGGKQLTSADEALTGYDRALKTITSVVVNQADIVFIEDLLLEGKTDLTGAGVLLKQAMDALSAANEEQINRADRRRKAKTRTAGSKGTAKLATR